MVFGNKKKEVLHFLLYRWKTLSGYAALEKIYCDHSETASKFGIDIPPSVENASSIKAVKQIDLIKQTIVTILPETSFIITNYEAPSELQPKDFAELYINHQDICLQRVKDLIIKNSIQ